MGVSKTINLEKEIFRRENNYPSEVRVWKILHSKGIYWRRKETRKLFYCVWSAGRLFESSWFCLYRCDKKLNLQKAAAIVIGASNRNVIFQIKRLSIKDQQKFVQIFLEELKMNLQRGIRTIVIDEMHKFAPESRKNRFKRNH